jgi:hypothetical protein
MTRTSFPGGYFVDAWPDGTKAVLYQGSHIQTHLRRVSFPEGEQFGLMYLTCTPHGGFKLAGQAHDAVGVTWEWTAAAGWHKLPFATGRGAYGPSGAFVDSLPAGIQFVTPEGRAMSRVETYGPFKRLSEWVKVGDFYIGQGHDLGGVRVVGPDSLLRTLDEGHCVFIHGHELGERVTVSYVKAGEGAVVVDLTFAELRQLPLAEVVPDVIVSPAPSEPKPMNQEILPERLQEIVEALYERNLKLAHSNNDDDRRILARMIAEQACFELGDEWGWKSNHGVGISPAKDAIAKRLGPVRLNERQALLIWDLFNGSTRKPNERPLSMPEHESNQFFIPVEPVNHLAVVPFPKPLPQEPTVPTVPNPGPIVPNPGTVTVDVNPVLAPLKAEIAALKERLNDLQAQLRNLPKPEAPKELKLPRRVALRSNKNGKLLCVDIGDVAVANRDNRGSWETFDFEIVE